MDDYFGRYRYGVKFPDGTIVDPEIVKLETTDEPLIRVKPHPKRAAMFGPEPEKVPVVAGPSRVIPFDDTPIDPIGLFRGRPISKMSKEELLEFATWASKKIEQLEKEVREDKHFI